MAGRTGSVHRLRPLPQAPLRGRFIVPQELVTSTREVLIGFAQIGGRDGGHEGVVYWTGRETPEAVVLVGVVVPESVHGPYRVHVSPESTGAMARAARAQRLGVLCQVHSHPGDDTRHSDGDDELVLMPFEGMLSLVAPDYGRGLLEFPDFGVHQYQQSRWVECLPESVSAGVVVVPTVTDLRRNDK